MQTRQRVADPRPVRIYATSKLPPRRRRARWRGSTLSTVCCLLRPAAVAAAVHPTGKEASPAWIPAAAQAGRGVQWFGCRVCVGGACFDEETLRRWEVRWV